LASIPRRIAGPATPTSATAKLRFHEDLRTRAGTQRDVDAALRALRRLTGDGASAAALERRRAILPR
jgi:hypothetical protein